MAATGLVMAQSPHNATKLRLFIKMCKKTSSLLAELPFLHTFLTHKAQAARRTQKTTEELPLSHRFRGSMLFIAIANRDLPFYHGIWLNDTDGSRIFFELKHNGTGLEWLCHPKGRTHDAGPYIGICPSKERPRHAATLHQTNTYCLCVRMASGARSASGPISSCFNSKPKISMKTPCSSAHFRDQRISRRAHAPPRNKYRENKSFAAFIAIVAGTPAAPYYI